MKFRLFDLLALNMDITFFLYTTISLFRRTEFLEVFKKEKDKVDISPRIVSIITNQVTKTNAPRANENNNPISFAEAIKLASNLQATKNQDFFIRHQENT